MSLLKDHTEAPPQGVLFDGSYIKAIVGDGSFLDFVETVDQVGDRGLAGTGASDESDFLSGVGSQADVEQYLLPFNIAEIHILEADLASERHKPLRGFIAIPPPAPPRGTEGRSPQTP